jgi:hypothetical protein
MQGYAHEDEGRKDDMELGWYGAVLWSVGTAEL